MHPLAATTISDLQRAGVEFRVPDCIDDIAALDAAARDTERLDTWRAVDLLDRPLVVGSTDSPHGQPAILYRPSYAALRWISDTAAQCGAHENLCVAWALSVARFPERLARDGASPRRAVCTALAWVSTLNCSIAAVMEAARSLLEEARPVRVAGEQAVASGAPSPRASERLALARLMKEYGQTAEYWLYGPKERTDAAFDLMRRTDEAKARAVARAEGRYYAKECDDPSVRAFVRWRAARADFEAKYRPPGFTT